MDFHSLPRRDLQFFCKRNKIPANMTNIAMADALRDLEIVEGMDEFMDPSRDQSPTSVARNLPSAARTAARTTRRKSTKDETQSSELVTRSCYVVSKSLAGEMDQENKDMNMLQNPSVPQSRAVKLDVNDIMPEANVSKTPAARSTRRAQAAASSKKDESVQRVYSTRRSVRLLEESMADLSLKTNVPVKKHEDSPAGSKFQAKSDENSENTDKGGVMSGRDLNDSLEKEWDGSKNDPDLDILYGDLGDITFFDASTSKEHLNRTDSSTVSASDSFVLVNEHETSQEDGFVVVDHATSTTTTNTLACNKESEPEQMKIDSESESEETEYETDPWEGDDFGVAVHTNQEAFESKVSASDNVSKVDSVATVLIADESKELDFSSSPLAVEELEEDSDEWSDYEIGEVELEENSCGSEESIEIESEEAPVSDKKTPASSSSSSLAGNETRTSLSPFEAESILESEEDKEMAVNNNGEGKAEAEVKKTKKKKTIDEELKDVSMRQLTKMVKELAIKSKQQHKGPE
ncbi:hypothetical protein [Arabidopsis thaliana]|uniref:LisH domain-like protein n=1 Tax=Arabidopsis thaliana TaxID=3702 RepID=Q9M9N2_ARATH|nr:lisH domain-like protein [Arabidopsis thaliana]AAF26111.1 hypothetical protein [Arabidopsis thaliana]AAX55167.1 hypothetical protein At3g03130 [Arabidopsis thaliana]AEE73905.1 lisH domain-like protein [Arabidopsis thaliana]|eukprot:NP_186963.1 lisH domain-like protein [Arabidopsis thaliana]